MATALATFAPPTTCESFVSTYGSTVSKISKQVARDPAQADDIAQAFWLEVCTKGIQKTIGKTCEEEREFIKRIRCAMYFLRGNPSHSIDALDIDCQSLTENTNQHNETGTTMEGFVNRNRCTQHEGMRNQVGRVLFLQEFLGFVEAHDPELLPRIINLENCKVLTARGISWPGKGGAAPKELLIECEQVIAKIIALAEKFEDKPLSGRKNFYIEKDSVGGGNGFSQGNGYSHTTTDVMSKMTRSLLTGAMPILEEKEPDLAKWGKLWLSGMSPLEAGAQMGWTPKQTKAKYGHMQQQLYKFSRGML